MYTGHGATSKEGQGPGYYGEGISTITGKSHHELMHLAAVREKALYEMLQQTPGYKGQHIAPLTDKQLAALETANRISGEKNPYYLDTEHSLQRAKDVDIQGAANPYLERAADIPTGYINAYLQRYRQQVVNPMKEEGIEQFLEKTMPGLNAQYAGAGAFHSGSRQEALRRERENLFKHQTREEGRLMAQGEEQAMKHAYGQQGVNTNLAKLAGELGTAQQQGQLHAAQAYGAAGKERLSDQLARNAQLENAGYREQEQKQREIEAARKEHHRVTEEGLHRATAMAPLVAGMAGPVSTYSTSLSAPPPPATNWAAMMGSGLQQAYGATQGGKKRGGRIGYAHGGSPTLPPMPPQYSDAQLPAMQTPEIQYMQQTAQQMGHSHGNAHARSIGYSGAKMAEASGRGMRPWAAYGHGAAEGEKYRGELEQKQHENRHQGAALMGKINESRLAQHTMIHDYQQKKAEFEQKKLVDAATIKHHEASANHLNAQAGIGHGGEDADDLPTKKMTPAREKAINEADAGIDSALGLIIQARETNKSLKKVGTSPLVGGVAEFPGLKQTGLGPYIASVFPGAGTPEDIANASAMSGEYLGQLRDAGEKTGRSIPELRMRQESKAGVGKSAAYNEFHTGKTETGGGKLIAQHLRKMELAGAPPSMIRATRERIEEALSAGEATRSGKPVEQTSPLGAAAAAGEDGGKSKNDILREAIAAKKKELANA